MEIARNHAREDAGTATPAYVGPDGVEMKFWRAFLCSVFMLAALGAPLEAQKPAFTVGWSVYVGWNPYYYMAKSGIMKKWADKYGITIKVQRFDYAPSLERSEERR